MPTLLPRLGAAMAGAFLLSGCALTDGLTLGEEAAVNPTVLQEAGRTGGGVDGGGGAGGGGHGEGGRAGNTKTIGKPKIDGPTLGVLPPGPCVGGSCPSDAGLPAVQGDVKPGDDVGLKEVDPVDGGKVAGPSPQLNPGLGGQAAPPEGDLGGAVKPGDDVGIIVINGKVAGPGLGGQAPPEGDLGGTPPPEGDLVGK